MVASAVPLGGLTIPAYFLASNGAMGDRLIAQLMLAVGAAAANVVTAALLCEVFLTRVRCTASAVTYNVSYAIFGGTAPFVATYLIAVTGNRLAPAIYITVIVLSAFAVSLLTPETAGRVFFVATRYPAWEQNWCCHRLCRKRGGNLGFPAKVVDREFCRECAVASCLEFYKSCRVEGILWLRCRSPRMPRWPVGPRCGKPGSLAIITASVAGIARNERFGGFLDPPRAASASNLGLRARGS